MEGTDSLHFTDLNTVLPLEMQAVVRETNRVRGKQDYSSYESLLVPDTRQAFLC